MAEEQENRTEPGQLSDPVAELAARQAASADRLLPGEEAALSSGYVDDARSWAETYAELFAFKQSLLATLSEQRDNVRRQGLDEVQNDEILLTREADRLGRRLEYWQRELERRAEAGSQ